jgi:putative MATE family efflux protein
MRNLFQGIKALRHSHFFRTILRLAVPMALQNFFVFSLAMVDTLMIGQLGEVQIASVGLANQVFFLLMLYLYGITTGTAVFTAQFWGSKNIPGIRHALGLCLQVATGGAGAVALISLIFPRLIISLFSKDPAVIDIGSAYLRIVSVSFIWSAISMSFSMVLRSIERPKLPLLITFVSLLLNTGLNYLLIFGKAGFTALGVKGAAIATTISRGLECLFFLLVVYLDKESSDGAVSDSSPAVGHPLAGRLREFLIVPRGFVKQYFTIAIPVVLNELSWALGFTMYKVVYARMGTNVIAAINISDTIINILLVVIHGTSNACAVMIGNVLGTGHKEKAFTYAVRFAILGPVIGLLLSCMLIPISAWVPLLFKVSRSVRQITRQILLLHAIFLPFDVFNWQLIVGILRSGGDTRYSMFLEIGTMWGYGVPLAFISGLVLHQPIWLVFTLVRSEEVVKFIIGLFRLISKKWIRILSR